MHGQTQITFKVGLSFSFYILMLLHMRKKCSNLSTCISFLLS